MSVFSLFLLFYHQNWNTKNLMSRLYLLLSVYILYKGIQHPPLMSLGNIGTLSKTIFDKYSSTIYSRCRNWHNLMKRQDKMLRSRSWWQFVIWRSALCSLSSRLSWHGSLNMIIPTLNVFVLIAIVLDILSWCLRYFPMP